MTAGTVVITGGIIAAVILLTIVTVLCYCRLQYYCCKREESDGEEEEPDFTSTSPSPPCQSSPPSPLSALNIYPPLEFSSSNQLLMTAEPYEPNGRAVSCPLSPVLPHRPIRPYTFCPSCSAYLPFYLRPQDELDNGGGRVSYRSMHQRGMDLPMDMPSFNKLNLLQSVTMREVVAHRSVSTDV